MVKAAVPGGKVAVPMASNLVANVDRIPRYKGILDDIRRQVRERFERSASAVHTTTLQSELFDKFVVMVLTDHLQDLDAATRARIEAHSSLLAVGGSGRAEMCPCSDVDLLFLFAPSVAAEYEPLAAQVQRDFWDCGLKVGASVRTVTDSIAWAKQEPQFATSLVDARRLWGSTHLFDQLQSRYRRRVVRARRQQFIADAVAARDKERADYGATTQQLEPDLKRSLGGLRDLHLIRWIGFARHDVTDIESLLLHSAITMEESRRLIHAHEFLTGLRIELHLAAGKEQDVLTREEQLRIARKRDIQPGEAQLPVERFMQEYFQHSSAVADIARRFVTRTKESRWTERFVRFVMSYRVDDIYRVGPDYVDIPRRHRAAALSSLEGILKLFMTAARYRVRVAPHLLELIKSQSLPNVAEAPAYG